MDYVLAPKIPVRYKATSSKAGLMVLGALSPLWLLWLPWMTFSKATGAMDLLQALCLPAYMALFGICLFTVFVCLQNRFLITANGVKFPIRCLLEVKGKLDRGWHELSGIEFRADGEVSTKPTEMVLRFGGGACLPLELSAFSKEDLQKFLMAVDAYRPQLPFNPELPRVELGIAETARAQANISFTQIWEEDMSGRFGSTVFVPLEPGQSLQNGALQVVGQIAFGGLSAIYLAKRAGGGDLAGHRSLCVIKEAVIPTSADEASRAKAMEMFEREAKILMALKHPRIAGVLDNFVEQGRHYLLLEYIEGKDLRKFVKENGPQKEEMVLRWAREILTTLDYLHTLTPPVIHRDLTPDNLVLEKDGSITMIDFGAANAFIGTATGTLVGKQSYISPEQFRGKATPSSDLYALGATLFFLLTGKDPEPLSSAQPKQYADFVTDEFDAFIASLTDMEPEGRPGSCAQALERLAQVEANRKAVIKLKV